jgi:hypothetical protein
MAFDLGSGHPEQRRGVEVDSTRWSGEGTFTTMLVEQLRALGGVEFIRIEDAPASHTEANYNFISNEIYVRFELEPATESGRLLGVLPVRRRVMKPAMTLADLQGRLAALDEVGPPDYWDEAMLQYLKTERIIPPYQTRGYKLIEMVRIYRLTA